MPDFQENTIEQEGRISNYRLLRKGQQKHQGEASPRKGDAVLHAHWNYVLKTNQMIDFWKFMDVYHVIRCHYHIIYVYGWY